MRKTFTRSEENKRKLSEATKASWVARKEKYGNSQGCSDPDGRRRKIGLANKGKLVVPLGTLAWNKGLTKDTDPRLLEVSKKNTINSTLNAAETWRKRVEKYGQSGCREGYQVWNKGLTGLPKNPHSEECKRKISEAHLKFHQENPGKGGWSGKHLSSEHRTKLRKASAVRLAKQPHKDTKPERVMAAILDELKIKYDRQRAVDSSIPDFFIEPNLCVFVDGDYWHNRLEVKARDVYVNGRLSELGYNVKRFWDYEIYDNPEDVKKRLVVV